MLFIKYRKQPQCILRLQQLSEVVIATLHSWTSLTSCKHSKTRFVNTRLHYLCLLRDRIFAIKLLSESVQPRIPIYDKRDTRGRYTHQRICCVLCLPNGTTMPFTSVFKFQEAKLGFHRLHNVAHDLPLQMQTPSYYYWLEHYHHFCVMQYVACQTSN